MLCWFNGTRLTLCHLFLEFESPEYSEEWAFEDPDIDTFALDVTSSWNNHFVTAYVVERVVTETLIVDKLKVELRNIDFDDVELYNACLEVDGKGLFIDIPRAPAAFYKDFEKSYKKSIDHDLDHAAHAVQALKIQQESFERIKTLYYKFPSGMICNKSQFNKIRDGLLLEKKPTPLVSRSFPGPPDINGNPKTFTQFIFGVKWECVIADSVAMVRNAAKEDNGYMNALFDSFSHFDVSG